MANPQSAGTNINDQRSLIKETIREAVSTAKLAFADDGETLSVLLNNCAEQFRTLEMFEDAKPLYQEAIQLRRDNGLIDLTFAQFLHNLAYLYIEAGEPGLAKPVQEESLKIFRNLLAYNDPLIAQSLNNLATCYHQAGDFKTARELYQESIQLKETYSGKKDKQNYAASLSNLADLEMEAGKNAAAKALFEQLEEASAGTADEKDLHIGHLYKEAIVLSRLGNYTQAETILLKVQHLLRSEGKENSEEFIRTRVEMAGIKSDQNKFDEAEALLLGSVEQMRKAGNWLKDDLPSALNNLGLLYFNKWQYDKAQQLLTECIKIRKETLGEDHEKYLTSLNNLALVYHHKGNLVKAEELYSRVLNGRKKVLYENHPETAQSMFNLGMLYMETERHELALEIIEKQFQMEDNVLKDVFAVSSEHERLAYSLKLKEYLNTFLFQVFNLMENNPKAIQLAFDIVLRRKGIVIEALKVDRVKILSLQAADIQQVFTKLTDLRKQISRAILDGPGNNDYKTHRVLISKMQEEKGRLESALSRELHGESADFFLQNTNRHLIAEGLPGDSVLIEVLKWDLVGSENLVTTGFGKRSKNSSVYSAFVLPGGEPDNVQLFHFGLAESGGESMGMEMAVSLFRSSITMEAPESVVSEDLPLDLGTGSINEKAIGIELTKILINRIMPAFGGRKKLIISPDGILNRLPYEVLPLDGGGYLSDEFTISYVSSGREVLPLMNPKKNYVSNHSIVIANPAFELLSGEPLQENSIAERKIEQPFIADEASNNRLQEIRSIHLRFTPLRDTEEEGDWIANELDAVLWKGEQALESELKNCQSPRILHLATHGFFLPEGKLTRTGKTISEEVHEAENLLLYMQNPMLRSGIVLAGANDWLDGKTLPVQAEDGLLTAEDVCAMDLRGTELVVLSACETGLGDYQTGEGVFGLRRAFELAGAHSLVMSLWKVPSGPTRSLMKEFYRQVLSGKSRVDALRNAKTILRRRFPEVFYWGGFVLSGDTGPIKI